MTILIPFFNPCNYFAKGDCNDEKFNFLRFIISDIRI